jgi:O-antigen/teichoic acid export membrane protein
LSDSRKQTLRIAHGTAARFVGRTLGAIISLVALHEATRYFGPIQWGPITAALAWVTVFSYLGSPGVAMLTMREIAKPGADASTIFGRALTATIVVSVGGGIAALILGVPTYWGRTATLTLMLIMVPGIPLMALFMTGGSVLVGRGRSGSRAALDTISSVFLLAATLVVVEAHLRSSGYAVAYVCSVAASGLIALALARRLVRPKLRGSLRGLAGTLKSSLPFGQFDLFAIVYARADSIMLFLIRGSRPVALYGVAYQVANFIFAMPALLSNALLPDFMNASNERQQFLARRALDAILTVAIPLPLFGALFSRPFVIWIAGSRYAGAGTPLAILTGAGAIALCNGYLVQVAIFAGAERGLWRVIGTITVVNLAANAVAVTLWGVDGAASVMILSEAVGLAMYWKIYRGKMPNPLGRRYPLSVIGASLGLLAICWALHAGLGLGPGAGVVMLARAVMLGLAYATLLYLLTFSARHLASRRDKARAERG